ncbi:MAG: FkbM family methyltransferase [Mesorhizobium sp.]|nr:FkbM family methyltransferase [Mesorhizobium sp.]
MTRKHRFSEAEIRLLEQLKGFGYQPAVIYDVGASNGIWSKVVAEIYPQAIYHLFEPLSDRLDAYRDKMAANLAAHPNFTLHKIGLGDANANLDMAIYANGVGSTFIEMERLKTQKQRLQDSGHLSDIAEFPVRRLDDFAKEVGLPSPNLIKMDTQGYEPTIIAGGEEMVRKADVVILETWLYKGYGETTPLLHELIDQMTKLNFVLTDFGDIYWAPGHKLTSIDAVFMRRDFVDEIKSQTENWSWRIWD